MNDSGKGKGRRGTRRGEAVEKVPTGVAEQQAARAAGREPIDARTKEPLEDPDLGRMERPDAGYRGNDADREQLANTADKEPHDRQS